MFVKILRMQRCYKENKLQIHFLNKPSTFDIILTLQIPSSFVSLTFPCQIQKRKEVQKIELFTSRKNGHRILHLFTEGSTVKFSNTSHLKKRKTLHPRKSI